jgi:signal transduction histidine kinase
MNFAPLLDETQQPVSHRRGTALVLTAMLLLLHYTLWQEPGSLLARALLLAHLGLFLIWQPIWRSDIRLGWGDLAAFALFTTALMVWLDWWLLCAWLILLVGLVAGTTATDPNARLVHLGTLVFLLSELLMRALTRAFELPPLPPALVASFQHGLPLLAVLLLLVPVSLTRRGQAREVDLLRALNAALVTTVLALGSLLGMYHSGLSYADALIRCLLALALLLLLTSWVLTPRLGLNRVLSLWERSLLNIGTPFERWLDRISALMPEQRSARALVEAGAQALGQLPWVDGATWSGPGLIGKVGSEGKHFVDVSTEGFDMRVYTRGRAGPMLRLHCTLLVRVLGHFERAKAGEEALAAATRLRAVHETGARVTHDIRNLLQALQPLVAAVDPARSPQDPERVLALLARTLPDLARRLALAVDRLQSPTDEPLPESRPASEWWQAAQSRYRYRDRRVSFAPAALTVGSLPGELFDNVLENLIDNALRKPRAAGGGFGTASIVVQLAPTGAGFALDVRDDGPALPAELAAVICRFPVASNYGLGIGLYQAALQAERSGYRLSLAENSAGAVVFRLAVSPQSG